MQSTHSLQRTVVKNASANLVRLAGSGIVAILLPPFLVRMLPTDTYSAWALLLQLTVYVGLLDFGVQTAVARYVAHAEELQDDRLRDGIVSTAAVLLSIAAALAMCLVGLLAWQLPHIFTHMPGHLYRGAQIALLLMGCSFALGLPSSVIHAVFIGLQRNEIPAAIVIANRFGLAALTVGVVFQHWGLAAMGGAVATANVLAYATACLAWRHWAPGVRIRISLVTRAHAGQIANYSVAMAVWLAGMLMVSGLDLSIVGIFDYSSTAYYAVAAALTNFVIQAQNAIFAALLPASAVLNARGDAQRLGTLLISSTRYGMFILLGMALPLIFAGKYILRFWVGAEYAHNSLTILQILVVANVVRLSALPYSTLLLGTGEQRKVIMSPLAEGITNLAASIGCAYLWGAIGVAIGTLIGSFVGVALHVFHNMPRTLAIAIDRSALFKHGFLRPLLCSAPLLLVATPLLFISTLSIGTASLLSCLAILGTGYLFWNYGLLQSERQRLGGVFRTHEI